LIYVIGSGLSGIAAAVALIKRGYRPTILDVGLTPGNEASALKARLASVEPEAWTPDDIELVKRTGPASLSGIPQKLTFGSDFAYRDVDAQTSALLDNASMRRSFARGGFSNVWGAVIQEFPSEEFLRWPVTPRQLSTHYSAVQELMCSSSGPFIRPSSQARAFYNDMLRNRPELERNGIRFSYPRLAVRSSDGGPEKSCRRCGLCLYGCPYDSIFAAGVILERLVREGAVSHVPGVVVDRVTSNNGGVRVEGRSSTGRGPCSFEGSAVFIAAGLLESARIILNSSTAKTGGRTSLPVRTSDIFTLPVLRYRSVSQIATERMHTLCQMVMNIDDPAITRHPVHLQLYGYNDLYPEILARRMGPLSRSLKPLFQHLAERLFVAFGYLHSEISSAIRFRRAVSSTGKLSIEGQENPEGRHVARSIARKLLRNRRFLRALPVTPQVKFDLPGGGIRTGGCFPMRSTPREMETDLWGRVPDLPGIHVVDSSVLPTIPAGPLAFTVMANAHRIASECPIAYGK
jgi:choline dehydrogenase-like flavoprotein